MSNIIALKKPQPESLRKLDVYLHIEGQTSDDSQLAPLVNGAIKDFLHNAPSTIEGKFESRGGLDVSWRVLNRHYEDGKLTLVCGVDEHGRRFNGYQDGQFNAPEIALYAQRPVPLDFASISEDGMEVTVLGVKYSRSFFENFAQPDPDALYRFARRGDQVVIEIVPPPAEPLIQLPGDGRH